MEKRFSLDGVVWSSPVAMDMLKIVCTKHWGFTILRWKYLFSSLPPVGEFLSIADAFCNSPVSDFDPSLINFDPSLINCPGQASRRCNGEGCSTAHILAERVNVANTFFWRCILKRWQGGVVCVWVELCSLLLLRWLLGEKSEELC